jgi:hypothetical protein
MPTPRCNPAGALGSDGRIYVFGGSQDPPGAMLLSIVEVYDPTTDRWSAQPTMPTARSHMGAAAVGENIYVIGGPGSNVVEIYNLATQTWSTGSPMPTARHTLGVARAPNGKIFAVGGWGGYLDTIEELDPQTGKWRSLPSMPTARSWVNAAVTADGKLYAIGGEHLGVLNTVELLQLPYQSSDFYNPAWISPALFQAQTDISAQVPRGAYTLTVQEAVGSDGIEIAPHTAFTFTVDYAGAIGDTTPPLAPHVSACAALASDTLSAEWRASDPDGTITLYRYAIGSTPGGTQVINWTQTQGTSFLRSGLGLTRGQIYYVLVQARNAGGLWSPAGVSPGVAAGTGQCSAAPVFIPVMRS